MIIIRLTMTACLLDLVDRLEKMSLFGTDITTVEFVELMDMAFVDEAYRDVHELDLYEKLSGSVPTDPLVSMLSSVIYHMELILRNTIPAVYYVIPDRVEYDEGTFTLFWREGTC